MDMNAQVVIVGGGLAGFSAALEIAEAGGEALVLEKRAESGGSTARSGGCFAFAGTDLQEKQGIRDSSELLFKDLREVGRFDNVEAVVQSYVDHQLDTYEWMCRQGVVFDPDLQVAGGMSVPRGHSIGCSALAPGVLAPGVGLTLTFTRAALLRVGFVAASAGSPDFRGGVGRRSPGSRGV